MAPLNPTSITDFRVEPAKGEYLPGEDVLFAGRLWVWSSLFPRDWVPRSAGEVHVLLDSTEAGTGRTDPDGTFRIAALLPATPGLYVYRAYFPGADLDDPSWSAAILVKVVVEPPPPEDMLPPPPEPQPVPWPIVMAAAAGAVGIGLIVWGLTK